MKFRTIFKIIIVNIKISFNEVFSRNTSLTPYKALIQLTNGCNSKCKSCLIWKTNINNPELKNVELAPKDYQFFFSSYGKNLHWMALSGGEISLYENFSDFLEIAARNCPSLCILTFTTNGLLPEKILDISKNIRKIFPDIDFFITISLDGNEELHDRLRGVSGNFKLAMKTYELLKLNKFYVQFGLTLSNQNTGYITNLKSSDDLNAKAISIVHSEGIYKQKLSIKDNDLIVALKKIIKLYRIQSIGEVIELLFLKLGLSFLHQDRKKLPIPCDVLKSSIHISPYGEILPCMFLPSLGNIKSDNLQDVLKSERAQLELARIKREECPKCWMNCYAPHSMMRHPLKTLMALIPFR